MKKINMMVQGLAVAAVLCIVSAAPAAMLTAGLAVPVRAGSEVAYLQGSNHIFAGAMVCKTGSTNVAPANDTSGYVFVGCAKEDSDNTLANYSATRKVTVRRGVFRYGNSGLFTINDVGSWAYVADDNNVWTAALATNDVVAGVIVDVDTSGVWVDNHSVGGSGAASFTTLSASGAAALSGTLAVGGAAGLQGAVNIIGAAGLASTLSVTGAVVCVADCKAATLSIASGQLQRVGAALDWIEGGVTNVLDANIAAP